MTEHQKHKEIIKKLCIFDKQIKWAKEIKIAKQLYKEFPDIDFFLKTDIDYGPTNTLSGLLTKESQEYLSILYQEYIRRKTIQEHKNKQVDKPKKKYIVEEDNIQLGQPSLKPKTVFEFLKPYGSKEKISRKSRAGRPKGSD